MKRIKYFNLSFVVIIYSPNPTFVPSFSEIGDLSCITPCLVPLAMGSPLGPVLANIFMCDFEEKWVMNNGARPTIWFRYVDDTFTLFNNKDTAVQFPSYLNSRHKNTQFTSRQLSHGSFHIGPKN